MTPEPAEHALITTARHLAPRLLTQVSRDPRQPHHGCFDRNYWHYHIRDFPSVILQQGGLACQALSSMRKPPVDGDLLRDVATSAALFWNDRAQRRGAFEEYYPYEMGYPPLAFSTLAATLLVRDGAVSADQIQVGLRAAADQLVSRFEAEAGNQQVAGLAALAGIRSIAPDLVTRAELDRVAGRTLRLQHREGWFPEYDGPDVGYLAVAIDCLWDYFDVTADDRALDAIDRAVSFIAELIGGSRRSIGMLNSRNTDYLVPYGLVRTATSGSASAPTAQQLVDQLFSVIDDDHFLAALDDRYLCHYLGTSVMRAAALLERDDVPRPTDGEHSQRRRRSERFSLLPVSGLAVWHLEGASMRASLNKGGVFLLDAPTPLADFGYDIEIGDEQFVSHWWAASWTTTAHEGGFSVKGPFYRAPHLRPSPIKHTGLRAASALVGPRLISALKSKMIFAQPSDSLEFERTVEIVDQQLRITDRLIGLPADAVVHRSGRQSMRHVASADSFHPEDSTKRALIETRLLDGDLVVQRQHDWRVEHRRGDQHPDGS